MIRKRKQSFYRNKIEAISVIVIFKFKVMNSWKINAQSKETHKGIPLFDMTKWK